MNVIYREQDNFFFTDFCDSNIQIFFISGKKKIFKVYDFQKNRTKLARVPADEIKQRK